MANKPVAAGKSSFDLIDSSKFFSQLDIAPGSQVVDLACGVGRYSIELSKQVNESGLIYSIDLWDEGIETLKRAIKDQGISNIKPIKADITKHIPLEDRSIDLCLMATILHDLSDEEQYLTIKEVARVLKNGGILAIIEFKVMKGPGPAMNIRLSEKDVAERVNKFELVQIAGAEIGEFNYMLTFKKNSGQ